MVLGSRCTEVALFSLPERQPEALSDTEEEKPVLVRFSPPNEAKCTHWQLALVSRTSFIISPAVLYIIRSGNKANLCFFLQAQVVIFDFLFSLLWISTIKEYFFWKTKKQPHKRRKRNYFMANHSWVVIQKTCPRLVSLSCPFTTEQSREQRIWHFKWKTEAALTVASQYS